MFLKKKLESKVILFGKYKKHKSRLIFLSNVSRMDFIFDNSLNTVDFQFFFPRKGGFNFFEVEDFYFFKAIIFFLYFKYFEIFFDQKRRPHIRCGQWKPWKGCRPPPGCYHPPPALACVEVRMLRTTVPQYRCTVFFLFLTH